jgi:predicted nucleic acid-binding protein
MDRSRKGVRAVVDTNVTAYYLLGTRAFLDESRRFWQAVDRPTAPALWEAEVANVVWRAIRAGALSEEGGAARLQLAARLGIQSVSNRKLWYGALSSAAESRVAIRDTLFVELARQERIPLATFDTKLIKAFPEIAQRPEAIVGR